MYGRWAINQDAGPQEAASIAATLNTPENLRSIIQSLEAIMRQTMTDGTEIVLLHPTGPYTDRALMLGAYNEEIKPVNRDGSVRSTHWIYDYSNETQEVYWGLVVAGLKAGKAILEEEGRVGAVTNKYLENSTHVSNHRFRTSRTITFPHGQFVERDPGVLHETTHVPQHLIDERGILL